MRGIKRERERDVDREGGELRKFRERNAAWAKACFLQPRVLAHLTEDCRDICYHHHHQQASLSSSLSSSASFIIIIISSSSSSKLHHHQQASSSSSSAAAAASFIISKLHHHHHHHHQVSWPWHVQAIEFRVGILAGTKVKAPKASLGCGERERVNFLEFCVVSRLLAPLCDTLVSGELGGLLRGAFQNSKKIIFFLRTCGSVRD